MGGPGSGPQGGGGKMVSIDLPKNPKKLTMQQADKGLKAHGYELGTPVGFDSKTSSPIYAVRKGGQGSTMTVVQIRKLLYGK